MWALTGTMSSAHWRRSWTGPSVASTWPGLTTASSSTTRQWDCTGGSCNHGSTATPSCRAVIEKLPDLVGPVAERFDLRFTGPDGREHPDAALLLVSNNPYLFDPRPGRGTRGAMDGGTLGVVSLTNGPPWQGMREWATPAFRVESDKVVEVGLDGEAVVMDPPLVFESLPSALRIRVPGR